jgi:folate-dependent phosphoribosylglycinamide formyltransferase PurN
MKAGRVVLFCGAVPDPGALRLLDILDGDPRVEVVAAFAESPGLGTRARLTDLWRRRRWLTVPIVASESAAAVSTFVRSPRSSLRQHRRQARLLNRFEVVRDLHAPAVLRGLRQLAPDLGLVYGAPILRPELFSLPRLGTLGIHHGQVPRYRGKKTTFWAMYHGEPTVGVTIQRLNAGIDTGEIVKAGEVAVGRRSYREVWHDLEALGLTLFHRAVVEVLEDRASFAPQTGPKGRLYRDPKLRDLARFWARQLTGSQPARKAVV